MNLTVIKDIKNDRDEHGRRSPAYAKARRQMRRKERHDAEAELRTELKEIRPETVPLGEGEWWADSQEVEILAAEIQGMEDECRFCEEDCGDCLNSWCLYYCKEALRSRIISREVQNILGW